MQFKDCESPGLKSLLINKNVFLDVPKVVNTFILETNFGIVVPFYLLSNFMSPPNLQKKQAWYVQCPYKAITITTTIITTTTTGTTTAITPTTTTTATTATSDH